MRDKLILAASLNAMRAKLADMRETLLRGLIREGVDGGGLVLLSKSTRLTTLR